MWQRRKTERRTLATATIPQQDLIHLRLAATDRTRFEFAVSPDGRTWKTLAGAEGGYLPPWDLSVRIALLLSGPPKSSARFGAFTLEPAS